MFEPYNEKLISHRAFIRRLIKYFLIYVAIIGGSLVIGIIGYHQTENMPVIDAFLNAAMLMGGMGPVNTLNTDAGKLFAGFYALYCGLIEILSLGVLFSPVMHRFLHALNVERPKKEEIEKEKQREKKKVEKGEKPGIL